jgi:membrane-associated phospholipid phosphatase
VNRRRFPEESVALNPGYFSFIYFYGVYCIRSILHSVEFRFLNRVRLSWWRSGLREITILLCIYGLYSLIQGSVADEGAMAVSNAFNIIALEKQLNIYWEPNIQSWFMGRMPLVYIANSLYTLLFYPVLITFGVWAYKRHHEKYTSVRNVFILTAVIGLFCFTFFPMAPPRLLSGLGFIDTLNEFQIISYNSPMSAALVNPYAAMPSFHFAWALLVGIAIFYVSKDRWLRAMGILLPLLMLISTVATANHFFLDAVAGGVVTTISYGVVMIINRLNRQHNLVENSIEVY